MKKLATFCTGMLCIAALPAFGAGDKHMHKDMPMHKNMEMNMKAMDVNKDGMISKDEFMRHHETMWSQMKKNSSGMVDLKDMGAMHEKMHGDKAVKDKDK